MTIKHRGQQLISFVHLVTWPVAPHLLIDTIEIQIANWQGVLTEDGKPGGTFRTFFVCTSERGR